MERLFRHANHGGGITGVSAKRTCNKAPVRDGIGLGFFKVNWESIKGDMLAIFNRMYLKGKIMGPQMHGIVVCIPKTDSSSTPADYRPITSLNTDYKIVVRIVATRLRPTLPEVLLQSQHCGLPENTIFDAVVTVRDAIAYAELTHASLCILSLDFTAAFDVLISDATEVWIQQAFHRYHKRDV
jgi:hypothetical protein